MQVVSGRQVVVDWALAKARFTDPAVQDAAGEHTDLCCNNAVACWCHTNVVLCLLAAHFTHVDLLHAGDTMQQNLKGLSATAQPAAASQTQVYFAWIQLLFSPAKLQARLSGSWWNAAFRC